MAMDHHLASHLFLQVQIKLSLPVAQTYAWHRHVSGESESKSEELLQSLIIYISS